MRLLACRKCAACVWPEEVSSHLQGREHGLSREHGREAQQIIQQWPNVLHKGDSLPVLNDVVPRIPELKLHRNGLSCQVVPEQCQHIRRTEKAIQHHCSIAHPGVRGRRGARCKAQRGQAPQKPWKVVDCQQLFVRRQGSQLFEVEVEEEEPAAPAVKPPPSDKIEKARQMLITRMDKIEDQERRIIEDGVYHAPSPWLRQTGFAQYLRGSIETSCCRASPLHGPRRSWCATSSGKP